MDESGPASLRSIAIDAVDPIEVGPGCRLRMLPVDGPVEAWVAEIDAGCEWPEVDEHDAFGESYWVISGEMIEGDRRFGAGAPAATSAPAWSASTSSERAGHQGVGA